MFELLGIVKYPRMFFQIISTLSKRIIKKKFSTIFLFVIKTFCNYSFSSNTTFDVSWNGDAIMNIIVNMMAYRRVSSVIRTVLQFSSIFRTKFKSNAIRVLTMCVFPSHFLQESIYFFIMHWGRRFYVLGRITRRTRPNAVHAI